MQARHLYVDAANFPIPDFQSTLHVADLILDLEVSLSDNLDSIPALLLQLLVFTAEFFDGLLEAVIDMVEAFGNRVFQGSCL